MKLLSTFALVLLFQLNASAKVTDAYLKYSKVFYIDAFQSEDGENVALDLLDQKPLTAAITTARGRHLQDLRRRLLFSFAIGSTTTVFEKAMDIARASFGEQEYTLLLGGTYTFTNSFAYLVAPDKENPVDRLENIRRLNVLLKSELINPYHVRGSGYTGLTSLLALTLKNNYTPTEILKIFSGFKWDISKDVNQRLGHLYNLSNLERGTLYGVLANYKLLSLEFMKQLENHGLASWNHVLVGEITCCTAPFPEPNRNIKLSASDIFALVMPLTEDNSDVLALYFSEIYDYLSLEQNVASEELDRFKDLLHLRGKPQWLINSIR